MPKFTTRKMPLTGKAPATLDEENRTVEAIMTTEQPVRVFDWEHGITDEVLLVKGAVYPDQVPLLDNHNRWDGVEKVLGSVSDIRLEDDRMVGTVTFSRVQAGYDAYQKVAEGHLTDFSIGYIVTKAVYVPENESQTIEGKTFTGPVKVSTEWELKELSITPIGADDQAKARSFQEVPMPKPTDNTPQNEDLLAQERTRADAIMNLGDQFACQTEAREAIRSGLAVADFQSQVLEKMAQERKAPAARVEMGATDEEKFRGAAEEALLVRAGISDKREEAADLASHTLRDMARECLIRSGQRPQGSPLAMIGRAMTSSDFPKILANTANKSLLAGYEGDDNSSWKTWCGTGSISDFKQLSIVRPSEMSDLEQVLENGEYTYGDRDETREQVQLATYGRLFAITRQAIINDDLGALTDIPRAHGEAAARKVCDCAYAVLTANANMADGTPLFHADHGNLAGTGGAPSITTLAAAIAAMKIQKDIAGLRVLNIRPRFFIAPVALEGSCEQLFRSTLEGTQASPNQINPYAGNYFQRVYDARLDGDDANGWYLAGPKGKTVTMFFLNGIQKPYLETKDGFEVDAVEYKVRIDCAAAAVDHRALYMNDGGAE
jgi:hypothetical protein